MSLQLWSCCVCESIAISKKSGCDALPRQGKLNHLLSFFYIVESPPLPSRFPFLLLRTKSAILLLYHSPPSFSKKNNIKNILLGCQILIAHRSVPSCSRLLVPHLSCDLVTIKQN
eukprot:TRINITY_DN2663_c2_g1_i1.p2 TRINITY_DN2663_c2_g1~~TRINITY_DN2663_c2_g1_i1.p2  ORF type:complete len:115 (+),score=8.69 TRINITY_DN2663_c2_g1_i1:1457-1801(+)